MHPRLDNDLPRNMVDRLSESKGYAKNSVTSYNVLGYKEECQG